MEEKRGIITGGTSGIGLAAAKMLVRDGAHVFIVGRDAEKGKAALTALSDGKGKATYVEADVSTLEGCQKVVEAAGEGNAKVDFLVNCAGMYQEEALQDITEASYSKMMDENVRVQSSLQRRFFPCSVTTVFHPQHCIRCCLEGNYGCAVYAASKGAVVAFTRSAALDLSPWVRVNCLCPGDVNTPLVKKQLEEGGYTVESMASIYPVGRIGEPEEVAHVICAVLSPLNGFMTGAILSVDGGLTAK